MKPQFKVLARRSEMKTSSTINGNSRTKKRLKQKGEREVEVLPYHSQVANPRCNLSLSSDPSVRTQDLEELAVNDGDWRGDRDGN
jgi:hypothetical protein